MFDGAIIQDGGSGSGNFKHEGRPGKVGGSAEKGGKSQKVNIEEKIKSVKIDFNKDNILPELNSEDLEELGVESKPVRLKKNIIDLNKYRHPDISSEEAVSLIAQALYSPEYIVPGKREGSYLFISQSDGKDSPLVLLDIEQNEDGYFDIVHFFKVRERGKKALIKEKR